VSQRTWNLSVEGHLHQVDVFHGYWSARREVRVDGQTVLSIRPNPLQVAAWWMLPSDHAFAIAGHAAVLRVTPDLGHNSYKLDLALDGRWVDSGQLVEQLPGPFGVSLSEQSTTAPRDLLLVAAFFFVGAAAVFGVAASEWGTSPPGRPYDIGGLLALSYATVGGGFLAVADGAMLGAPHRRDAVFLAVAAGLGLLGTLIYATPVVASPIRFLIGDALAAALVAVGFWCVLMTGLLSFFAVLGAAWSLLGARRRTVLRRLALALIPTLGVLVALVIVGGPADWRQTPRAEPFAWALALSIIAAGLMLFTRPRAETAAWEVQA